jgi:hypothetical protein
MTAVTVPARDLRPGDTLAYQESLGEVIEYVIADPGQYVTVGLPSGIRHYQPDAEVTVWTPRPHRVAGLCEVCRGPVAYERVNRLIHVSRGRYVYRAHRPKLVNR